MTAEGRPAGVDLPVDAATDWLLETALTEFDRETAIAAFCERLVAAGIPLWRVQLSFRTLHPLVAAETVHWKRGAAAWAEAHPHGLAERSEEWLRSPFFHMLSTDTRIMRRRLAGPDARIDFPALADRRAGGGTDWLGCMVAFSEDGEDGIISSWATDAPGGFDDAAVAALPLVARRLAVVLKLSVRERIAGNVLAAYLGPESGRRVLAGRIRRGDGEAIRAVVWYSDMRASTAIAAALPASALLEVVNSYFECTAGAVLAAGGEVLQLIGDAVLAFFPVRGDDEADACGRAAAAAQEALRRRDAVRAAATDPHRRGLAFGVGLHLGDLVYGNVGVPERLEFGVVGVTVNETARLQDLTKLLGEPVLATGAVARSRPADWRPLGVHSLRGLDAEHAIFGLAPVAAPV